MKGLFKNFSIDLTFVFAACAMLLGVYAVICHIQMDKAEKQVGVLSTTISDLSQEMESYVVTMDDSMEFYVGRVRTLNMTVDNLQARYKKLYAATRIRAEDVGLMATVSDTIRDTVLVKAAKDPFGGVSTGYRDNFINISVAIDSACLARIDYFVRDSLSLVVSQKRHSILFGLIKWKEYERATVINHNPKARMSSLEVINRIE